MFEGFRRGDNDRSNAIMVKSGIWLIVTGIQSVLEDEDPHVIGGQLLLLLLLL